MDNTWPDKVRTRITVPDKPTASRIDLKIRAACVDEARVWKAMRTSLGLECGFEQHDFPTLVKKYISDYCAANNRHLGTKIRRLRMLSGAFGSFPKMAEVDAYIARRKKAGLKNATLNKDIGVLRHLCKWLLSRGYIKENPLAGMSRLKEVEWVGERPDESVIDSIFSHIAPEALPIFVFIRETGCRHWEAVSLTWDKVDFSKQSVAFHTNTKNSKARHVPLTSAALAALSSMPRHGKTVFYHPVSLGMWSRWQLGGAWQRARRQVTVGSGEDAHPSRLRIHDLRHAYAIKLAEAGCPMHFISEVIGHHSVDFTRKRYARFSPDSASKAVLKVLEGGRR